MTETQGIPNSTETISDTSRAELALKEAFQSGKAEFKLTPFDRIALATGSPKKQQALTETAKELGISTELILFPLPPEEEKKLGKDYAYLLQKRGENPELHSFDLVLSKLANITMGDYPVIAMDTTLIDQKGNVIEKPENKAAAKVQIESMLGSRIKTVIAIGLIANNSSNQKVLIREGVEVSLKTKRMSEDEINEYIESNPELLQVSGGIDFAGMGQIFIDESEPILVRGIDFGKKVLGESTLGKKEVRLSKSAIGEIATYFIGAPKHPINAMLSLGQ